jgi:DNA-binding protein HU-beta
MNKAALIEKIAEKTGSGKKLSESMVNAMVDIIIDELQKGGDVSVTGFGTFETMTRYARGGVNPQRPNERIQIPAVTVAKFRTGKRLKDSLKNAKPAVKAEAPVQ